MEKILVVALLLLVFGCGESSWNDGRLGHRLSPDESCSDSCYPYAYKIGHSKQEYNNFYRITCFCLQADSDQWQKKPFITWTDKRPGGRK